MRGDVCFLGGLCAFHKKGSLRAAVMRKGRPEFVKSNKKLQKDAKMRCSRIMHSKKNTISLYEKSFWCSPAEDMSCNLFINIVEKWALYA